jgi:hypothetical protein
MENIGALSLKVLANTKLAQQEKKDRRAEALRRVREDMKQNVSAEPSSLNVWPKPDY